MPPQMKELGVVELATPCRMDWDLMAGDDRVRFCGKCRQNVYNLTALDADDARTLLLENEGLPMCVRFFQRADGTVLTRDCAPRWPPVTKRRLARPGLRGVVLALVAVFIGIAVHVVERFRELSGRGCELPRPEEVSRHPRGQWLNGGMTTRPETDL